MGTEQCCVRNCVRVLGHAGAHTAAPSARTMDWDLARTPLQAGLMDDAALLLMLDWPTPHWGTALDPL